MATTREPVTGRQDLEASFTWIQRDTLTFLLGGVGAGLWGWFVSFVGRDDEFWPGWGVPVVALGVVACSSLLKARSFRASARLFLGGLLAIWCALLFGPTPQPLAPFLSLPIVLIAGTLEGPRAAFAVAALASLATVAEAPITGRPGGAATVAGVLALVWVTALAAWATTRTLYVALHWAWANSEQAQRHLEEARDYQGKLASALRQLEEANYRLKRANYALEWARAEADEARRLKAGFAAHVSHELRTPINLIVGFSDLMLHHLDVYGNVTLSETYVADLTTLQRSAHHLQGLIDDILDLSQIDAGEMPILKDLTEVGALVHEAVATARSLLDRKGLAVAIQVDPDLPFVCVDRLRIRQVLLNLLNNAARFTERGAVAVRASWQAPDVVVEVEDTGAGIDPAELDTLFQPFHQLGTAVTTAGGTGLGLAISKRFVELHGGRIWASSPGKRRGSTFGFALPVGREDDSVPQGSPDEAGRHWGAPATTPAPTIVVLDRDPAILRLFQRYLEGYRVVGASSEEEAVARVREAGAHAIVTDLPRPDGAAEWQGGWLRRSQEAGVRVVAVPMPSGQRGARVLGLTDYLVKPITREKLLESLQVVAPLARTVLVVDDDPKMVRLLCRMLRSAPRPYVPLGAYGGRQALDILRRRTPDLLLLDIVMPGVDGLALLELIRADRTLADLPVIAVSAHGVTEAIAPSSARTVMCISDEAWSVSRLLRTARTMLDALPPARTRDGGSAPWPRAAPVASEAS